MDSCADDQINIDRSFWNFNNLFWLRRCVFVWFLFILYCWIKAGKKIDPNNAFYFLFLFPALASYVLISWAPLIAVHLVAWVDEVQIVTSKIYMYPPAYKSILESNGREYYPIYWNVIYTLAIVISPLSVILLRIDWDYDRSTSNLIDYVDLYPKIFFVLSVLIIAFILFDTVGDDIRGTNPKNIKYYFVPAGFTVPLATMSFLLARILDKKGRYQI